ncbi:homocysteine S-methyltransferase 1-like isoform X2 [Schistocerca piceifrons]|uniref:homocysteine S-methyltransferase 1-like isoform X2 n=1 Tax=Schistocerca piceifrons TaxID=274613 RepID=UPI001F5E9A2B|nr:homocysteine S-methyltransferase 1-like isoform X2 [Schistocerca piceifrons]
MFGILIFRKMSSDKERVKVLDGGFATQLSTHVSAPVDGNPLWSSAFLKTDPEAVVMTHCDFLRAGAQIITTNTYQASIGGFMKYLGLTEEESIDLIKKAVDLAKDAVAIFMEECTDQTGIVKPLIAASVGPYGASLHNGSEYSGSYVETVSKKQMMDWHRSRMQVLVNAGVDFLAIETIPAQDEAEALADLLKEFSTQKAWISFSCKDHHHVSHGENFREAVASCLKHNPQQIIAVGTNCVNPAYISSLLKDADQKIPFIVYPNSGEKYDAKTGWHSGDSCKPIESYVHEWLDLGVQYIGGCCRTYPADISKIRDTVESWTRDHVSGKNKKEL